MGTKLKYMPIFRSRQQENDVLKSFDFGTQIYPCVEIIKELDRLPPKPKKDAKKSAKPKKPKKTKVFEDVYVPLIQKIKAEKVFVDLPIHLPPTKNMKPETLSFLRTVVADRVTRTEYITRLKGLSSKIIPVISSYHNLTGEKGSIALQANDLRPIFSALAFRTFTESFSRDIPHIEPLLKKEDYLIVDWDGLMLDISDSEQRQIVDKLKTLSCNIIIHRNPIDKELTNVGLVHKAVIDSIDNSLLDKFKKFSGSCFSDYSGIKKDGVTKGGSISPGFVYYDAVENNFYGFKGVYEKPATYETIIIPDVIKSHASRRMKDDRLDFLGLGNIGWQIIQRINRKEQPGRYAGIFKRIGLEHYLHTIKTKVANGDFD